MALPPTLATDIFTAKELALTYQPLLLAEFTFYEGTVLRVSTRNLTGSFQYGGNDYAPRILNQDIGALFQAVSSQGIDMPARVKLELADADKFLWTNYQSAIGFKGATLRLTFVLWEVGTSNFSTDAQLRFTGICDPPQFDHQRLSVAATSKLNLAQKDYPAVRIQPRCPWAFPRTATERQAGADNPFSIYRFCGYSPDATGGQERGNNDPNTTLPFTSCDFTFQACQARLGRASPAAGDGVLDKDEAGRATGRFGGITFSPPKTFRGRTFGESKFQEFENNQNEAKYDDRIPEVYGRAWIDPPVLHTLADGNATRGEVIVSFETISDIERVRINDFIIPGATDIDGGGRPVRDPLFAYYVLNNGDRQGHSNSLPGWNNKGDPYGNYAAFAFVVFNEVAASNAIPRVQVLVKGVRVRVYTAPNTWSWEWSENPAWILLHFLFRSGWTADEIDQQSFIDAAAVCAAQVSYVDSAGRTRQHARYNAALPAKQPRSASDIVLGLRRACKGILAENQADGKLRLRIKQTLGDQQPVPISGSNYATAVKSIDAAAANKDGYVAYRFDESNILITGDVDNERPQFSGRIRSINDSPNIVSMAFPDADDDHAPTTLSIVELEDVVRSNREVRRRLNAEGVPNQDQAKRIIATEIAETLRGNPLQDTGGTQIYEIVTTFRGMHLNKGDIVLLQLAQLNLQDNLESPPGTPIAGALFQVVELQPSLDLETLKITLNWHRDEWYTDIWGQVDDPGFSRPERDRLSRAPFPWLASNTFPQANDALLPVTFGNFGVAQEYETAADQTAFARLVISGKLPVNTFSDLAKAALVPLQGTTQSTGGTLEGGRDYWMALCSTDAAQSGDFGISPPSQLIKVSVPSGTATNQITVSDVAWPAGATGHVLFAGRDPYQLSEQARADTTPDAFTLTKIDEGRLGMPDVEFDRIRLRTKRNEHAGVWGAQVTGVGAGTITVAGAGWTTNEWAGRTVSLIGKTGTAPLPIQNYSVSSNTADTLTVSPDPQLSSLAIGDVIVMRTAPTAITSTTVTDAKFVNSFAPGGLNTDEEVGRIIRILYGTGAEQVRRVKQNTADTFNVERAWDIDPDATSVFIVEAAEWDTDANLTTSADIAAYDGPQREMRIPAANLANTTLLVQALTIDGGGNPSPDPMSPVREIYIFGDAGSIPGAVAPASQVTSPSASEDPFVQKDGTVVSEVTFSYVEPIATDTFDGVDVYLTRPGQEAVLVTTVQKNPSPSARRFLYPTPEPPETVELRFLEFNTAGQRGVFASAATTTVLLDGKQSPPSAVADPHAQEVQDGIEYSWDENPETDISHYVIAHTGDRIPANSDRPGAAPPGAIKLHNIVGELKADRNSDRRARWLYKERIFEGDSDGTVITIVGGSSLFAVNELIVQTGAGPDVFEGINIRFHASDGSTQSHRPESNTKSTLTFPISSIPTGRVRFDLRGANGEHYHWIAAVDTSANISDWRPVAPAVLVPSPLALDGTKDIDVPEINLGVGSSQWTPGSSTNGTPGTFDIRLSCRQPNIENEPDFDKAVMRNIRGVSRWQLRISATASDPAPVLMNFDASNAPENYTFFNSVPSNEFWFLTNQFDGIPFPDRQIAKIEARAHNSHGWGPWLQVTAFGVPAGSGPWYTGSGTVQPPAAPTESGTDLHPNLAETHNFIAAGLTADRTLRKPLYRASDALPTVGDDVQVGESFDVMIKQDATGGKRIIFDTTVYKGTENKPTDERANRYTIWTFLVEATNVFRCKNVDTGDV